MAKPTLSLNYKMNFELILYWFLLVLLTVICFVEVGIANSLSHSQPSCPEHERSALLQLKHTFVIDCSLASDSPYAHPVTSSWVSSGAPDDENCCSWEGVKCSKETGHVIGLDLSSSCLYGTFPSNTTLFHLPHLGELDLSDNDFNKSGIPSGLGHRLSKLTSLNLSASAFSGHVPSDISKLSRLTLLDLSDNHDLRLMPLSLERLVQNMTHLNQLVLDSVDISSPMTNLLSNFSSLKTVSLGACNLYGEFPIGVFHLPHLEELDVSENTDLTGTFPNFEHSSPLTYLNLPFTSFSGEIPSSIANLANLEALDVYGCGFSGQVPYSIGNLTKLTDLQLGMNYFHGDIPSSFTNLTRLQILSISDLNAMPDKLYPWLSKQNKLLRLDLVSMNLAGEIPSIISNFTSLIYLILDDNHFTGPIPHWIMNLTDLIYLSLANNRLEGSLPPSFSQLESLHTLLLDGNHNIHLNFETLLKLKSVMDLSLNGLRLTFPANITTNEMHAKFNDLSLESCNLTEFPTFLQSQDQLQVLKLSGNNIQGLIPLWFVNVTVDSLIKLHLSSNLLSGFEQPTNVLPWVNLKILYLDGNKFQGSILLPPKSMVMYQVSDNSLTGEIPHELCSSTALNYLDLSFNNLTRQIPICIGQLSSSLKMLNLQGNNFHGNLPSGYPKSCTLKMINLSQNRFTGNMPRSLSNCRMLEVLDIGSNQVNDTFPSWLEDLPNLQILVLRHNNFHGRIERSQATFGFHSLRIIDLSHNFHIGDLPSHYLQKWDAMKIMNENQGDASGTSATIMKWIQPYMYFLNIIYHYKITITNKGSDILYTKILTVFRVVDFSSNKFTGSIPEFIGQLKGLQAINLSNNNLRGGIPSSLANIRDLESLDLSNNNISGEIPQQLTQLTSLEVFNLSNNLLVGPIPQGNQFNTFDSSSFYGNPGLCGGALSKRCGNENLPPPPALVPENEKDDESNVIDWVIRCLGCVSGFVIGYAIGTYMTDKNHDWFKETFTRRKPKTRTRQRQRS